MKSRPILFSAPMVRAILEGRKTQTRRVMKVQAPASCDRLARVMSSTDRKCEDRLHWVKVDDSGTGVVASDERYFDCPYGIVGDRLWVRETFAAKVAGCPEGLSYRADHVDPRGDGAAHPMTWTPSIHMPRWASRITLEVTGVRVERLNAISEDDARAEGVGLVLADDMGEQRRAMTDAIAKSRADGFRLLWESINGAGSWAASPWVWVVEFKAVQP